MHRVVADSSTHGSDEHGCQCIGFPIYSFISLSFPASSLCNYLNNSSIISIFVVFISLENYLNIPSIYGHFSEIYWIVSGLTIKPAVSSPFQTQPRGTSRPFPDPATFRKLGSEATQLKITQITATNATNIWPQIFIVLIKAVESVNRYKPPGNPSSPRSPYESETPPD